jgi:hypothetical protein
MFKHNEYFDGKVKSIAFSSEEGPATVGVMAAGEFEFGTDSIEVMTVISGSMEIKLPGSNQWKNFTTGEQFTVEKGIRFGVRTEADTSYLCLYK